MSTVTLEQAFDPLYRCRRPGPGNTLHRRKAASSFSRQTRKSSRACVSPSFSPPDGRAIATKILERRKELRAELDSLRTRYFDKIDRIAMSFGVDIAMKIKDEVEQRVTLPLRAGFADMIGGSAND